MMFGKLFTVVVYVEQEENPEAISHFNFSCVTGKQRSHQLLTLINCLQAVPLVVARQLCTHASLRLPGNATSAAGWCLTACPGLLCPFRGHIPCTGILLA